MGGRPREWVILTTIIGGCDAQVVSRSWYTDYSVLSKRNAIIAIVALSCGLLLVISYIILHLTRPKSELKKTESLVAFSSSDHKAAKPLFKSPNRDIKVSPAKDLQIHKKVSSTSNTDNIHMDRTQWSDMDKASESQRHASNYLKLTPTKDEKKPLLPPSEAQSTPNDEKDPPIKVRSVQAERLEADKKGTSSPTAALSSGPPIIEIPIKVLVRDGSAKKPGVQETGESSSLAPSARSETDKSGTGAEDESVKSNKSSNSKRYERSKRYKRSQRSKRSQKSRKSDKSDRNDSDTSSKSDSSEKGTVTARSKTGLQRGQEAETSGWGWVRSPAAAAVVNHQNMGAMPSSPYAPWLRPQFVAQPPTYEGNPALVQQNPTNGLAPGYIASPVYPSFPPPPGTPLPVYPQTQTVPQQNGYPMTYPNMVPMVISPVPQQNMPQYIQGQNGVPMGWMQPPVTDPTQLSLGPVTPRDKTEPGSEMDEKLR